MPAIHHPSPAQELYLTNSMRTTESGSFTTTAWSQDLNAPAAMLSMSGGMEYLPLLLQVHSKDSEGERQTRKLRRASTWAPIHADDIGNVA